LSYRVIDDRTIALSTIGPSRYRAIADLSDRAIEGNRAIADRAIELSGYRVHRDRVIAW
jgi:hypothetical protein